jgi:hypothetical protein
MSLHLTILTIGAVKHNADDIRTLRQSPVIINGIKISHLVALRAQCPSNSDTTPQRHLTLSARAARHHNNVQPIVQTLLKGNVAENPLK